MEIHQILPALSYGDAVSNDAIEIRNALRNMGYVSNIYAKYVHEIISKDACPLNKYKKNPNNIVIYHFSLGDLDVTKFVKLLPDTKILIYHNITPYYYFKGINDELAQLCRNGRYELKSLRKDIKHAFGVSEYNRKELLDYGFINTDVLPIIVDFSKYDLNPNNKIIQNFDDGYVNLLFVGRIAPNKKQEDLIKIFYNYKKINSKSRLILLGSCKGMDKYFMKLQEIVRRLNLTDVVFTGQTSFDEMLAYYHVADVFLCMSEHEGFCVPLLECMYLNVPIIAYNSTAIPYSLGNCGILVNEKRFDEIAEMINLLINDNTLRKKIVSGQRKRLQDFERIKIENKLRNYIENVFNSSERNECVDNIEKQPLVSVVICTYDRSKYLEKCIESIEKQTYPYFEIIIVNGPSTDETIQVLEKYPKIKVVMQEKLNGLSFARNLGIEASDGEIIAFIDDDAVADSNWINYLVKGYKSESIGGVGGPVFDITGEWYQFKNGYISKAGIPSFINEKDLNYNNPKGEFFNYVMGTNSSFRKSALYDIGLFDETIKYYIDETDVCVRMIKSGYKIKHLDNPIVFHEMAEGFNRMSCYDLNWHEIMKNVIYFTIKNFRNEFSSYTFRPAQSLISWIKHATYLYLNKYISQRQLIDIYLKLVRGGMNGYKDGLFFNMNWTKSDIK